ncbi:hypothetical protein ACFOEK_08550 [Litoribrevibacter euphylliae]|uniref:Porin n=1 Tax=Litoribrevibacter euphylliae TaxID=1834034 RepID=A0ABV7HF34_9GAMM
MWFKAFHLLFLAVLSVSVALPSVGAETTDAWGAWDDSSGSDRDWPEDTEQTSPWNVLVFTEALVGGFISDGLFKGNLFADNAFDEDLSALENRWQLNANRYFGTSFFNVSVELLADGVDDDHFQVLVRELYLDHSLTDSLTVRAGQQILTWGTGDFVFLNDLFAKDWQAMFSGRDDSYLKAPSTSIKLTYYQDMANLDVVWTPLFTSDNYINGERFGYFSPMSGDITDQQFTAKEPGTQIENGEFAFRLFKTLDGVEYALYGYRGFYKQPVGFDPVEGRNVFPRLNSVGASVRGSLGSGIANIEVAYWDSRDDMAGDDPLIPNSKWQTLVGYEQELIQKLTLGLQWWLQITEGYSVQKKSALKANSPQPEYLQNKYHHTLTARITYLTMSDKLTWSLFSFYSPSSDDFYLKPKVSYRRDDYWLFEVGGNLFGGQDNYTQWGQFEENSNLYTRVRYHF